MATVRLSNDKRDGIVTRYTRSLNPALDAQWAALVASVDHERFIDTLIEVWIKHEGCASIMDSLPSKWFDVDVKEIRLGRINGISSSQLDRLETKVGRRIPFFMTRQTERYGGNIPVTLDDPDLDELALKMLEMNETRELLDLKRRNAKDAIHKLVYDCQTLKQQLELWPGAENFINASDMDEHRRVAERTSKGKIAVSSDIIDTLNVGAVMGTMHSAARR